MIKTSITMWAPPVLFVGLSTNKYNVWGHHLVAISHIPGLACEARPAAGNDATGAPRVRHAHSGGRFGRYDLRQHLLLLCPEPFLETVARPGSGEEPGNSVLEMDKWDDI